MSKQPPTAPTESTIGPCPTVSQVSRSPCPTVSQVSRTPWHWKFTQHPRTTRPPPESAKSKDVVDIYCKYAHHYKFLCFFICKNAFYPGREFRTISLNSHYFFLFRNNRDLLQTEILGRQIFGKRQVKYFLDSFTKATRGVVGWCDGAGLTSSAGASYNLDFGRARAYCACSGCGWGLFGHFYYHLSFLFSCSLSLGDGPI